MGPPSPSGALPPGATGRRSTSIDFAENQLSPGLIGLSPLATAHPRLFQQAWVRPSSGCYPAFSLAMARSPGFGSPAGDWTRPSHSLSLRLRLAAWARRRRKLADPLYKRYAVTPARLPRQGSDCLWASGFRSVSLPSSGCFSPFPHGTRALSVAREYLGLEGGPPVFGQGFTCPALLKDPPAPHAYGAVTRCGAPFQALRLLPDGPLACSAFARRYSRNLG